MNTFCLIQRFFFFFGLKKQSPAERKIKLAVVLVALTHTQTLTHTLHISLLFTRHYIFFLTKPKEVLVMLRCIVKNKTKILVCKKIGTTTQRIKMNISVGQRLGNPSCRCEVLIKYVFLCVHMHCVRTEIQPCCNGERLPSPNMSPGVRRPDEV